MHYLFLITSVGFFIWTIRNILFWVELWQSKEYRLDRLTVHLFETVQGRKLFTSSISIIKWVLILCYGFVVFNENLSIYYQLTVCGLYLFESGRVLVEWLSGYKLRRPVKTMKALAIVGLTLLFTAILYFLPLIDSYVWFIILDRMVIFIIALFTFFFAFPTEIYTDLKIQKAKQLIQKHKKLIVIAVSGSYGKSSTKEFIAQLLETKYTVVKTIGSNNTPIGVTNTILHRISEQTEIFVVEMGAYKKGEVAELCDIVPPMISVTTSVSDQHLSLFGSLQNAIDTEMELVDALPKDGIALFNGNNENTLALYKKTKKTKILYKSFVYHSSEKENSSQPDIIATHVIQTEDGISFDVVLDKKQIHFRTPLLGIHMIENILPAIYIADHLGISFSQMKKAIASLTPPPKTMAKKTLNNGVTLIDDTFNASPESVKAAIAYLDVYKKKKILVLMPLVELGKHAKKRHYEIGLQASTTCDYLFVTNKNFYQQLKAGIEEGRGNCQLLYRRIPLLAKEIISLAKKNDVVIFEGKEAGKVLQELL